MAMQYDVKAETRSTDGTMYAARTRVKGLVISPNTGTSNSVKLLDGGPSGIVRLFVVTGSSTTTVPFQINIPGEGILFEKDVYLDITDAASVTVFYG